MIEDLQPLIPDASRSARTVARCHQRLAARRRTIEARSQPPRTRAVTIERWLVAGVCAVYLLAMAGDILTVAAMR